MKVCNKTGNKWQRPGDKWKVEREIEKRGAEGE